MSFTPRQTLPATANCLSGTLCSPHCHALAWSLSQACSHSAIRPWHTACLEAPRGSARAAQEAHLRSRHSNRCYQTVYAAVTPSMHRMSTQTASKAHRTASHRQRSSSSSRSRRSQTSLLAAGIAILASAPQTQCRIRAGAAKSARWMTRMRTPLASTPAHPAAILRYSCEQIRFSYDALLSTNSAFQAYADADSVCCVGLLRFMSIEHGNLEVLPVLMRVKGRQL